VTRRPAPVLSAAVRRRNGHGAVCLWWLLVVFGPAPAALAQYRFDSWTADQGLPQNIIRAIHQTADGYLWLATLDGLVRFDGVRFTVFNKGNSPGINGNRFISLYEDREGDLWFGTENSGVTRYRRGSFTTYTTEHGLLHNFVRGVTGDEAGHLWVLSADWIMQWQEASGRFIDVTPEQLKIGYHNNFWDERGGFWGVDQAGLHRLVNGRWITYTRQDGLPSLNINGLAEDPNGTVWVGTFDGLLARIIDGKVANVFRASEALPDPRTGVIPDPEMRIAYRDRRGETWTMGVGQGLIRSLTLPVSGRPEKVSFFPFCEDREGNLWLGTNGQGLYRVREQAITVYSKPHGLADRNVYVIHEDRAGAVWIGAWPGGLSRFKDGKFTNYTTRDGLASGLVTALHEDRAGRLWVSAHGADGGLRVFRDGRFTAVSDQIIPDRTEVAAIHEDSRGTFWFGTSRGLIGYAGGVRTMYTAKDGLAGDDVKVIIEDAAGHLWIGGYGGLTRFKDGAFSGWTERDGLPSNTVRALYADRDGVLWIGTYDGGLGRFKDGQFTRYTTGEGLFNNGVFQILEDARGNFWMSCNRGIYRVSKQELNEFAAGKRRAITSIAYGKSDGMLNAECNGGLWPAGVKTRDGKLWFPTQDGAAVIDPEAVPTNPQPPPVVIESFLLDRAPVALDRPVRIAPGRENFEIQYTALSFVNSEHLRFKYRLEGLDDAWVDAGTRRTAYYSHVPPGEYTFTVIAANSDGVWNTRGQSLRFAVLPPFYRTWWFITLAALGVAGLVWLSWRYRVAQLERAQATQRAFAGELIASQESERKRIAAELHDSLGQHLVIIKNLALMSLGAPAHNGRARQQIEEISAEASQAIGEVKEISYNLRPYQLDRIGLTKAVEAVVNKAAAASEIAFSAAIEKIDGLIPQESEINFYRIVQESVSNSVKHSQATEASVTVRREGDRLRLVIRDNGKGFTPGAPNARPGRGGFGLVGISERAQLLGGKAVIQSAPGQGTTVSIEIAVREGRHDR